MVNRCNKSSTSYVVMVKYDVVHQPGIDDNATVWTPCLRDLPSEGFPYDQEPDAYKSEDAAETSAAEWRLRFPTAEYIVLKVVAK